MTQYSSPGSIPVKRKDLDIFAIVDKSDYDELTRYRWYATPNGYVYRNRDASGVKTGSVYMHRQIMKPASRLEVDHVNGNRLDHRRSNLRVVTRRQNLQNCRGRRVSESGYRGVHRTLNRRSLGKRWKVLFDNNYIATFDTPEEAAVVWDCIAVQIRGRDAGSLNFPELFGAEFTSYMRDDTIIES
jgi:hypothetical protein